MSKTVSIKLATGTLHLDLIPGRIPLRRLLGFAARISSKRKYLLVSKILGKHYPASPLIMRWSYRALARAVLKQAFAGSSLWIGMAETATGLGYGVFEAACFAGCKSGLFMQTTRYHLDATEKLQFEEAHSHATDFFLYYPENATYRERFLSAETLVLIDDEISTGKTFACLIQAYRAINPQLRRVYIVSLVNFAEAKDRTAVESQAGVAVEWIYFRSGKIRFDEIENTALADIMVNVDSNGACKKALLGWPGRLGIAAPINLEKDVVSRVNALFKNEQDVRPLLVLGTGECNALSFMLGRELQQAGFKVKVQSTTRSPIHPGNDIVSVSQFEDNYQDGIPNYIYNLNPADYCEIILCHETPLCPVVIERLHAWHAISAQLEFVDSSTTGSPAPYAKLHFFRP